MATTALAQGPPENESPKLRVLPVRLLATQDEFQKNISASELATFIKQGTAVFRKLSGQATTNFDIRVTYTLRSDGKHSVKIARRGDPTKEWLKKLQSSLDTLAAPSTKSGDLKVEANYQIIGDKKAFAAKQSQNVKAANEKLAEMAQKELAQGDYSRTQIVPSDVAPEIALEEARKYSWPIVSLMIQKLRKTDESQFPGIHVWLKDFDTETGGKPPEESSIDIQKLISNNPNYWLANFEVAPGDVGWAIIHAGLLQACGEVKRSNHRLTIARQFTSDKTMLQTIASIDAQNFRVMNAFSPRTNEAIKLHDAKKYEAARDHYKGILDIWPQYAWCLYELSLTEDALNSIAAGRDVLPLNSVVTGADDLKTHAPSQQVIAHRVKARRHDPLAWQNLNGVPNGKRKIVALLQVGLPEFKKFTEAGSEQIAEGSLIKFAAVCQMIEAHELAMATLGVVVGRRNEYRQQDLDFIAKSLEALAPGSATNETLKRLGSGKQQAFAQIMAR